MQKAAPKKARPEQSQPRPGKQKDMRPQPITEFSDRPVAGKLKDKVAVITGGDSGIGKAVAILFAKEGADLAIIYWNEKEDALDTQQRVEALGRQCQLVEGDLSKENFCRKAVAAIIKKYGRVDILVNNAAIHYDSETLDDITTEHLTQTFYTNVFPLFWITKGCLPYMKEGSSIINTSSVAAYRGSPHLMDYAATKGAVTAFTRSLASNLVDKKIRVNGVAPGPVWTPLIASSFAPEKVAEFGTDVPMKRAGEPAEIAYAYLYLASDDSTYVTGQFIHPNGGEIING